MKKLILALAVLLAPAAAHAQFIPMPGMTAHPGGGGGGCPGSTNFGQDNFAAGTQGTDLNGQNDQLGHAWAAASSSSSILYNNMSLSTFWVERTTATPTGALYYNGGTPTCANYTVTALASSSLQDAGGVAARVSGSISAFTGYLCVYSYFVTGTGNGSWTIQRVTGGAGTVIGSTFAASSSSITLGETLAFTVGSAGALSCTGTGTDSFTITATDTTYTAAGSAGIYMYVGSGGGGYEITNFTAK